MKKGKLGKTVGFLALAGILILGVASCGNTAGGTGEGGGGEPELPTNVVDNTQMTTWSDGYNWAKGYQFGKWDDADYKKFNKGNNEAAAKRFAEIDAVMDKKIQDFKDAIQNFGYDAGGYNKANTEKMFNANLEKLVDYGNYDYLDAGIIENKKGNNYEKLIAPIFKNIDDNSDNDTWNKISSSFRKIILNAYADQQGGDDVARGSFNYNYNNYILASDSVNKYLLDNGITDVYGTFYTALEDVSSRTGIPTQLMKHAIDLYLTNVKVRAWRDQFEANMFVKSGCYVDLNIITKVGGENLMYLFIEIYDEVENAVTISKAVIKDNNNDMCMGMC